MYLKCSVKFSYFANVKLFIFAPCYIYLKNVEVDKYLLILTIHID